MLLDCYDALTAQIGTLTSRIEELIAAIPEARSMDAGGATGPGRARARTRRFRSAIARLDQIPGVGRHTAQVILAETGLDMARVPPTPPPTWPRGRSCRRGLSSPEPAAAAVRRSRTTLPLKGVLGAAGAATAKTDTFLGQRYQRSIKRPAASSRPLVKRLPAHPGDRLALARRSGRRLPGNPRCLLGQPHRQRQKDPQPCPRNSKCSGSSDSLTHAA